MGIRKPMMARSGWVPGDDDPECFDCSEPLGKDATGWERRGRFSTTGKLQTELVCPECCFKEDSGP